MGFECLKVGELAKRTGLTVRTLHHYDEIGLLRPSVRTESGHRLYTPGDVARLQLVVSLRQLGFSLEQVQACLDQPDFSPLEVIRQHVVRLREQIRLQQSLCAQLEAVAESLRSRGEVSAEQFLEAIEVMTMIESYYTPEQMETFRKRAAEAQAAGQDPQELARQGQIDWANLLADYKVELEKGTPANDPKVLALEKRRQALVNVFTGGDPGIAANLKRLWLEQGDTLCAQFGMDPKVMEYLRKVAEANEASA
jgi:DNA-binding transcriptional MerR regulator